MTDTPRDRRQSGNPGAREEQSRPLPPNMGRDPQEGDPRTGPESGVAKNTGPGPGGGTQPKGGGAHGERRG